MSQVKHASIAGVVSAAPALAKLNKSEWRMTTAHGGMTSRLRQNAKWRREASACQRLDGGQRGHVFQMMLSYHLLLAGLIWTLSKQHRLPVAQR